MLKISLAQFTDDILALREKLPGKVSGVCGVPRSGMIAASILACCLNTNLYEWTQSLEPRRLGRGARGLHLRERTDYPLVLIDDVAMSGATMRVAQDRFARLPMAGFFVAVYTSAEACGLLNLYSRIIPSTSQLHLEWNLPR